MAEEENIPMRDFDKPPPDESPDIDYDESHVSGTRETDFTYDNYDDPNRDYDREFDHSRNEHVNENFQEYLRNTLPPKPSEKLRLVNEKKRLIEGIFKGKVIKRASRDAAKLLDNISFESEWGRVKYVNFKNKRIGEVKYNYLSLLRGFEYNQKGGNEIQEFKKLISKAIKDTKKYKAKKFVQESHEMDLFEDTSRQTREGILKETFPKTTLSKDGMEVEEETSFISETMNTLEHQDIINTTLTSMMDLSDRRRDYLLNEANLDALEDEKMKKIIKDYCSQSIRVFEEKVPIKKRLRYLKSLRESFTKKQSKISKTIDQSQSDDLFEIFGRFQTILERDIDILHFKEGNVPEVNENLDTLNEKINTYTDVERYNKFKKALEESWLFQFLKRNGLPLGGIVATIGGTIVTSVIFLRIKTHQLGGQLVHNSKQLDKLRQEMKKERQKKQEEQALLEKIHLEIKKRAQLGEKTQAKPVLGPSQKEAKRQEQKVLQQKVLQSAKELSTAALLGTSSKSFDILGRGLFFLGDHLTVSLTVLSIGVTVVYVKN